jgi:multicomponent Na+:H+ antiporter subunit C
MSPNLTLVVVSSALIGTGVYLFLSRSLVRALMGFLLMGNGINLLFVISSGPAGSPPIVGESDSPMADPVPQALVLTAIVITLAMTAFVLALAHRGRQLDGMDLVSDDLESSRIHARAEADDMGEGPSARETAAAIQAEGERTESRFHEEVAPPPAEPHEVRAHPGTGGPSREDER